MPESIGRGALTEAVYYILLSLYQPMHGYAIMQQIRDMSDGRVILGPGTLYGAINTILDKGWIVSLDEPMNTKKREYVITDTGKAVVEKEINRLEQLVNIGVKVARGENHENNL